MLEEKLRQASEDKAKHRRRTALILGVAMLACAAVVVVISSVDFTSAPSSTPEATAPPVEAADTSGLREAFMQGLKAYEGELEPALAGANLTAWNGNKELEIAALKEAAVTSFATGDYAAALKNLAKLDTTAKQVLTEQDRIFTAELSAAKAALAVDDFDTGKLHITKARQVNPNDQEAMDIEAQIDALPLIAGLLKKANIARTENNLEKEYAAVAAALKVAPHRDGLQQRGAALAERIKERRFSTLISRGLANVKRRALGAARSNAKEAWALYPGRSELQVLSDGITKLADELDLERGISRGETAIAQDDWSAAQSIYRDALTRHPNDKALQDGAEISNKMVSLKKSLDGYLNRPERLSSPNIAAGAKEQLVLAKALSRISKSLAVQVSDLTKVLSQMNVKVSVLVRSDNQTNVQVKGVGKVGVIKEKTIQLKPGDYIFEGMRSGYKSKRVKVRIPVGSSQTKEVEVVCDEPI